MNDKPAAKLDELFAAARATKPDTSRAEFGFETRLLARLRSEGTAAAPGLAWVWRLVPVFAAIVVALGVWTLVEPAMVPADLHAALVGNGEQQQLVNLLTGD